MLPRHLLPQITGDEIDNFVKFCQKYDVQAKTVRIKAEDIIPIQKHLKPSKVKSLMKTNDWDTPPLLISVDHHLLDGHHRWAAELVKNRQSTIVCLKFSCPIEKLLELGHLFSGSEVKSISEVVVSS